MARTMTPKALGRANALADVMFRFLCRHGYQPGHAEVAAMLGLTPRMARIAIRDVAAAGYLRRPLGRRPTRCLGWLRYPDGTRFAGLEDAAPAGDPDADPPAAESLRVFRAIYDAAREHGYQPSVGEVAESLGVSTGSVVYHLHRLHAARYLRYPAGESWRALTLLRTPDGRPFGGFRQPAEGVADLEN